MSGGTEATTTATTASSHRRTEPDELYGMHSYDGKIDRASGLFVFTCRWREVNKGSVSTRPLNVDDVLPAIRHESRSD